MAISKSLFISTYECNLTRGSFALKIICFFLNNAHLEERYNIDGAAAQNNGIGVMGQSMDPERIPAEFNKRKERNNAVLAHVT